MTSSPKQAPAANTTTIRINEPFRLAAKHIGGAEPEPIGRPLTELEAILSHEATLVLPAFTADTAFALGTHLRNRLHAVSALPAVINIALANSNQLLFHACTHPGITPDSDFSVIRKRATVLRWGCSSYAMGRKFDGDWEAFAERYVLWSGAASEYAIAGGAVPVRVAGVEGIVAVVVVHGLSEEDCHQCVVESLEDLTVEMKRQ